MKTINISNIQQELLNNGVTHEEIDHHATDLYIKVSHASTKIINEYEFKQNVTTFTNYLDGSLWYDIPFAYVKSAYEEFVNNPKISPNQIHLIFELEVSQKIDDLIDFVRDFLKIKGFKYTGHNEKHNAIYNNRYIHVGTIQENNKIAIRLKESR